MNFLDLSYAHYFEFFYHLSHFKAFKIKNNQNFYFLFAVKFYFLYSNCEKNFEFIQGSGLFFLYNKKLFKKSKQNSFNIKNYTKIKTFILFSHFIFLTSQKD